MSDEKPADPYLEKQAWLDVVAPVERAGRLDHIPARKASTPREAETARRQNYALTRHTFAMPDTSGIRWERD